MATQKLSWDNTGERLWSTGIESTALYPMDLVTKTYPKGVAWNGVTSISESPSGAESNPKYADNIKYADVISKEDYAATIEAFMSPKEFDACDGAAEIIPGLTVRQQMRVPFGLAYKTKVGNDVENEDFGYVLHLVYACKAAPSERPHQTINEAIELESLSWALSTTPEKIPGKKPSAVMEIYSKTIDQAKLTAFETILFGSDAAAARLPLPAEVITLLTVAQG